MVQSRNYEAKYFCASKLSHLMVNMSKQKLRVWINPKNVEFFLALKNSPFIFIETQNSYLRQESF